MTSPNQTETKPPPSPAISTRTILASAILLGTFTLLLIGFLGGRAFERVRIRHSDNWRANYQQIFFNNSPRPLHPGPGPEPFVKANGAFGKILTIDDDTLTVEDRIGFEQSVVIKDSTTIKRDDANAKKEDLKIDQRIAVFGRPNNRGQITADFIRIFEQ